MKDLDIASIPSGRTVLLGDVKKVAQEIRPTVEIAHNAVADAVAKCERLDKDATRTEAARELAKKKVAEKALVAVGTAEAAIKGHAARLWQDALAASAAEFGPKSDRAALESDVRGWIREKMKTPEGIGEVRRAMNESADVAAVIWHSPRFLLDMPEEVHRSMCTDGLAKHRPEIAAKFEAAADLEHIAKRYPDTIRRLRFALYNHTLAEKAEKSRVEV